MASKTISVAETLAGLVANQPVGQNGGKPTSIGISSAALLRYLGAKGVRPKLAMSIMAKVCDGTISKNTVQAQLAAGRKGTGKVPTLTIPQEQKLAEVLSKITA